MIIRSPSAYDIHFFFFFFSFEYKYYNNNSTTSFTAFITPADLSAIATTFSTSLSYPMALATVSTNHSSIPNLDTVAVATTFSVAQKEVATVIGKLQLQMSMWEVDLQI